MLRRKLVGWSVLAIVAMVTVGCAQSDPGITTAVKAKLAADDTVKAYRIDVDTKDRVVTLSGAVDTAAARTKAVELARGTNGVRDVVDQLTVAPAATPTTGIDDDLQRKAAEAADKAKEAGGKTGEAARETADKAEDVASDATLTTKVKTKFLADTGVSGLRIDVDSKNGVVTLTGTVPTAAEKRRAIELAKNTDGVKSVTDRLKVGQ
jgi:hyperosmotically inducible protein